MEITIVRTSTFIILALLVISGCTSRTDGGARVRPLSNQPVSTPNTAIPSGIPLDDGSTNIQPNQTATPYNTGGEVQFPAYSGQPASFPGAPTSTDTNAFPAYPNTAYNTAAPTQQAPQQQTYSPSTPMIPGQNTAPATTSPKADYQASQNQTGAVQSLLDEANNAVKANQLEKAATALNRAVRLEPSNASIWYDLAQIRLHQGKFDQSEQLAKKSIDFAKGNQNLVNKNWRVISSARKARGDSAGADEAMRNAQ